MPGPRGACYTIGMKTAVSIADELFVQADALARRLGKSRSELYAEAIHEYLRRHDPEVVRRAWDELCASEPDGAAPDPLADATAKRSLERAEW